MLNLDYSIIRAYCITSTVQAIGDNQMVLDIKQSIYAELADFMVSLPTLETLATYTVSDGIQHHIDDLLERNREEDLSAQERLELDG